MMTSLRDGVLGVELAALEVATEQPAQLVRARLRDGVDLHTRRTALRGIELVGDELELGDRVLAEARLVASAQFRTDLLTVEVELELPALTVVAVRQRSRGVRGRRAAAGSEQRQRHPVAAVDRQLLHLLRIDVAADARVLEVDERRLARYRDRLGDRRGRHPQVNRRGLADQQLHAAPGRGGEPGQLPLASDAVLEPVDEGAGDGHRRLR